MFEKNGLVAKMIFIKNIVSQLIETKYIWEPKDIFTNQN
jgi:hypothetical protein